MRAGRLALLCVALEASVAMAQAPDLSVVYARLTDVSPPWPPTETAYFGQPFRLEASVVNEGDAPARDFVVSVALSANATLGLSADPIVAQSAPVTLAAGSATMVAVQGVVPATDPSGAALAPGLYWFFALAEDASDPDPSDNALSTAPERVIAPAPDLVPEDVIVAPVVAAGEAFGVSRTIRNVGNAGAPAASYHYVLSANPELSGQDLVLELAQPGGGFGPDGTIPALGAGASQTQTDWIRLPPSIVPGDWFLGVWVDPGDQIAELDEQNNGAVAQPVTVIASSLRISDAPLVDAVAGAPYTGTLVAEGAQGGVTWSLVSGPASLPDGVSLDGAGELRGTPSTVGVYPFEVEAKDAIGRSAKATCVLRVVAPGGAVTITSTRLPMLLAGAPYRANLAAQGGVTPYRWKVSAGALPEGLVLSGDGTLTGIIDAPAGETRDVEFQVFDAVGDWAVARFGLEVIAQNVLFIETDAFLEAQVGVPVSRDLTAHDASGNPLALPLSWELVDGRLPAGLRFEAGGDPVALLAGTPTEAGVFPITVTITDAKGREEDAPMIVVVHPSSARLVSTLPPQVQPGSTVDAELRFVDGTPANFTIESGTLPPGLTLLSEGRITGRVSADAPRTRFTFTVHARAANGIEGLLPAALEVVDPSAPPRATGCGCRAHGDAGLVPLALAALVLARARRRERRRA
ncbi:MAG: putative Ig domain-containing protein [Myxococcaceae bacterium]|nr:putative Ig domain-containing protein [Myxococcaceae bacterium]